ncbi:hypothetical protein N7462_008644 [Penicillium macrosclerotiorum]|uniref:uncharacterized protein n=1 Tax=Penicillium macrosclerotiorum TaxID=303699 RepID=UPI002547F868|nr:uncharacterized protein N7462_008644 [Penicillium macrosclerotiorum]KAJ5675747.1 hypothetical protein N7462_008644 [Penicillium macrosclerotiorum]
MYAESDYLMINGLKDKAKTKFEECFPLVSQKDAFALVIRELYSDPPRTNYHELRQSVSSWLAQKRPGKARTFMLSAVIDREILDESPKFARDLLLALIDRN